MSGLIPYRENAKLQVITPEKKYGLAIAPKPIPPHKCNPPGKLFRLWSWIAGRHIYKDSLWRCACGKFWILNERELLTPFVSWTWRKVHRDLHHAQTLKRWQEMGMTLLPSDTHNVLEDDHEDDCELPEEDDEDEE